MRSEKAMISVGHTKVLLEIKEEMNELLLSRADRNRVISYQSMTNSLKSHVIDNFLSFASFLLNMT